jgi:hypothetical protein
VNPLNKLLPNNTLTVLCRIESEPFRIRRRKTVTQQQRLVQDFGSLLQNKNNADVYFSFEDIEIGAHKTILAARSPVFAAMFQHNMQENEANQVEITEISSAVFEESLQFMPPETDVFYFSTESRINQEIRSRSIASIILFCVEIILLKNICFSWVSCLTVH